MKITLLAFGSRGDIQPFIALAVRLKKAGHLPLLAAPHKFQEFTNNYHIPFHPLPGDPEVISARFNDAGRNPFSTIRAISDYVFEIAADVAREAFKACEGAELVIHGFLFTAGGHSIARLQGIPDLSVQTFPMFAPTQAFPNVSVSSLPPGLLSYFSHWLFDRIFQYGGSFGYGRIRHKQVDIPLPAKLFWPFKASRDRPATPLVFAFSPSVIPPPFEWRRQPHIHIPGYFFLEEDPAPPVEQVSAFLDSGEPPVCITFGSMVNRQIGSVGPIILDALQRTRRRAIILTGWGEWGEASIRRDDVLILDSIDHTWLFPRCSLIIHHGGAGTTAAGLRSGTPSMVVPMAGDQPFWAKVVDGLRVGPHSIALRNMTVEKLVTVIAEAAAPAYVKNAKILGRVLRNEDGPGTVLKLVERYGVDKP